MLYSYFSPHAKSWSAQVYPGTPTFSLQPNKYHKNLSAGLLVLRNQRFGAFVISGGVKWASRLERQQNIKSARPGLLRNRKFQLFLHFEEVSNWRTMKANRHSRICRMPGCRTTSWWRAVNTSSAMGAIIQRTVLSAGTATANAWELKCGRQRNDHPCGIAKFAWFSPDNCPKL